MSDETELAPFCGAAIFDLAYTRMHGEVEGIFQERPNGALLVANPLIQPEPKYARCDTKEALKQSLVRFRDEVVCWATAVGEPEGRYITTALSKLWLSWVFGVPSEEVPAWALPFGITRWAGGFPLTFGCARLVAAYSGAAEMDDKMVAKVLVRNVVGTSESRRELVRRLDEPKVNFITPATLERLDTVRDVGHIPSLLNRVREADIQLAA